ncbi:TetR/AcrR family transcriptional regulator [Shewanella intestini]|uniref:TetR/AcrR family transcriptional regulator n=1 Tax=Shewanella intestini TaxID=2017544 RepID=A0ABS5I6L2_9GAMM|nr:MULTISPECIES: TetR-like C-terminal domain-containing protein [Shewanella]MBR9729359.1 TetR/AcrR family transcriptional regulator [Shewanella intestini]MRG37438.1 TetR/AcrR family transcriptional regulator [Shewanella sp. XMDDZSB0408]
MARRKEHTHAEIHGMAIIAVIHLLQTVNLENLSLRKVATEIGYAPSTLINIFGGYQQLLLAVSEQVLTDLYQQLVADYGEGAAMQPLNAQGIIEKMAHDYYQFANENRACFKLVFELSAPQGQALSLSHQQAIDRLFNLIANQLTQLFDDASNADIGLMSRVLWGGIHGLTCLAIDGKLFTEQAVLPTMLSSHVNGYLLGMAQQKGQTCC